jgi:precorrin-2/cobalt-factor-2 C20-methyltransferase
MTTSTTSATFYAVGVGPGDPELMTRKAARVLSEVDRIYSPSGEGGEPGIARGIVDALRLPSEKFRSVPVPMSRDRTGARSAYRRAAAEIAGDLELGRSAAWISAGDPLFYGTALYVLEELSRIRPGVRTEVIPGVTSVQAAAARVGMEVARLDEGVAILPAAYGLDHLAGTLEQFATVCLMKVNTAFDRLLDRLETLPGPFSAVYVERVGMAGERVVTDLASLRGQDLPYFSMVLIRSGRRGDADD